MQDKLERLALLRIFEETKYLSFRESAPAWYEDLVYGDDIKSTKIQLIT